MTNDLESQLTEARDWRTSIAPGNKCANTVAERLRPPTKFQATRQCLEVRGHLSEGGRRDRTLMSETNVNVYARCSHLPLTRLMGAAVMRFPTLWRKFMEVQQASSESFGSSVSARAGQTVYADDHHALIGKVEATNQS